MEATNQNFSTANNSGAIQMGTAGFTPTTEQAAAVVVESVDWTQVRRQSAYLGTFVAAWDVWNGVPDHPVQRVTSRHAAQLVLSRVLDMPLDLHRAVAAVIVGNVEDAAQVFQGEGAAVLRNEMVTKLDGHSRTLAQKDGHAPKPETVIVHLFAAADSAESARLYQAFDSSVSSKKTADKGQSALRAAGIEPTSALFMSSSVTLKAMRLAAAIIDEGGVQAKKLSGPAGVVMAEDLSLEDAMAMLVPGLELAKRFKPQIEKLDGLGIVGRVMPANADAVAAYIVMLVKDFATAGEFLGNLRAAKGECVDGRADALFMASQVVKMAMDKRRRLKGNERVAATVAALLSCFTAYKAGETFDANRLPGNATTIASMFEAERKAAAGGVLI